MRHDTNQLAIVAPKMEDRFRVRIDFKDKDIKLWYNDTFVNSCYKDEIPASAVAAASIYGGSITVTTTDYQ